MKTKPKTPAAVPAAPRPSAPPIKSPETQPLTAVLTTYRDNLAEMRRWYREQDGHGPHLGILVTAEMIHHDSVEALTLAIEGTLWNPKLHRKDR